MSILYITNKPIYPIIDGGCFAMESFLNALISCKVKIKHLCLSTQKHPFDIDLYPEEIQQITAPESVNINTNFSFSKAATSFIRNTSYNSDRFFSKEFCDKILSAIDSKTSVIILESSYLLVYLSEIKKKFKGKILVRTHNVEHLIWDDYAKNTRSILKKTTYNYLKKRLKKFEMKNLNAINGVISISKTDTLLFKQLGLNTPIHTLSVGIESINSEDISYNFNSNHFFFLGAFNWKPNKDAAEQLIHKIFPLIQKVIPSAELHIAGTFMPDDFFNYSSNSISIHGRIKDVPSFLLKSGTLIAPITSGSGIRIKILECLALGVPVIATKIALKGLEDSPAFCVNSIKDYVSYALQINSNTELIETYKKEAMNYIQQNHSTESIADNLKIIISGK